MIIFSTMQKRNLNVTMQISAQRSHIIYSLRAGSGPNQYPSLIWAAVSGRSVLRCRRQRVHSYHLTNSSDPQLLRTPAASENETRSPTTKYLTRCDSFSLRFLSASLHTKLLNFTLFYFAVSVGYCAQHFLYCGIHSNMRPGFFLLFCFVVPVYYSVIALCIE